MPRACREGFSAVEMLVVIGIFMVMTSVVMANLPQFREKTLLDLTAQQMATIIRQAQVYGLGTRSAGSSSYPSHGIFFNLGLSNKSMILFADTNGNNLYDSSSCPSGECVEQYNLQGAVEIFNLYGCDSYNNCSQNLSAQPTTIFFERPNPEAGFVWRISPLDVGLIKIIVRSTKNTSMCRNVVVSRTGQIYTRTNSSPLCDPNS